MKKIFLIAALLLLAEGCTETGKVQLETSQMDLHAIKFEFEGHSYIQFYKNAQGVTGFVHNPNCKCMIDYD